MKRQKIIKQLITLIVTTLLLVGCSTPEAAEPTRSLPTEEPTHAPPTPTATLIPPTPTETVIPTTETPPPIIYFEDTGFPTGKFKSGKHVLVFRTDGTGYYSEPGGVNFLTFGCNGDMFAQLTFSNSSGPQVPATYYWSFDGSQLTFILYGEDLRSSREYRASLTWTYVGKAVAGSETEGEAFPTGRFISQDGIRAFEFDEDGLWRFFDGDLDKPVRSGKYITNVSEFRSYYTELTHDNPDEQQVPVTYAWTFDGENLTFELWGEDVIPYRESIYNGQTYTWVED